MSNASELINFPCPDGEWRDSGEGGQFVKLVVPQPDDWENYCHVDSAIVLTQPDVCHNPGELWAPYDYDAVMTQHDVFRYMRRRREDQQAVVQDAQAAPAWAKEFHQGIDYQKWGSWAIRALDPEYLSTAMLAAVHLGSSGHSLWSERQSCYWLADEAALTEAGQRVADSLHVAFGIKPLLLTFLDT